MSTPYEKALEQTKARANDPLRVRKEELSRDLRQAVSGLIAKAANDEGAVDYGSNGSVSVKIATPFELEGRDHLVTTIIEQDDRSAEGATVITTVVTEYHGEEIENDFFDLSIDDQLSIYEALRDQQ